ncbi:MAG: pyrK, partial [Blastococcus sp.]|nr:pyrK [Blastococcus sp.]
MTGHNGHVGRLTAPAPPPSRPPVQAVAEVVGRRPVDAYVELTLAAPEIAERAQPGQFVAFAIGGDTSALLLRRSIAISTADDGLVTVVVSAAGPGSTWLTERHPGDVVDVVGPLGRPFPPAPPAARALL